ncbi:MAG: ParA family protein [Prevotella histicola]|uniref:ParA family protein n=1 Tax=Prevotella histicola TaxID=470565 RepID=UPI001C5F356A|nr:AAA family ATPase [Prevotella histicola]MBF1425480.1 ParA family protein [Prevotella histicola]MBW4876022.1 AAA family ATPase [Prevotella histicola]
MKKETKIIAFANHKGGVGKTTTTASVGSLLAKYGNKVLLVDLDAQANLTSSITNTTDYQSIYEILVKNEVPQPLSIKENLDLIPSSQELALADLQLAPVISREFILSRALSPIKEQYDFILMDCPPSLGLLTLNACCFANEIIIPLVAEVLPFKGLTMINEFIKNIHDLLNPSAHITGVLITRWEKTNLTSGIEQQLRSSWGDLIFNVKIRKNVTIAEAPLESSNIVEYAPNSHGAQDYTFFTSELKSRLL